MKLVDKILEAATAGGVVGKRTFYVVFTDPTQPLRGGGLTPVREGRPDSTLAGENAKGG